MPCLNDFHVYTLPHVRPFVCPFGPRNYKNMLNLSKIQKTSHDNLNGHRIWWKIWGHLTDVKKGAFKRTPLALYGNTLHCTWTIFGRASSDPNFCNQVGMPIEGIYG